MIDVRGRALQDAASVPFDVDDASARTRAPGPRPLGRRSGARGLARRGLRRRRRRRSAPPTPRSPPCATAARPATTASARGSSAIATEGGALHVELQPLRWALRLVEGDASAVDLRALRHRATARAAGSPAAAPRGWPPGPGAGRSAPAARSTRARARSTRSRASSTRSGRSPPSASGRGARAAARTTSSCSSARPGCPRAPSVTPDHEHDAHAWWPADIDAWPDEADEPLRRMARLLQ